MGLDALLNLKPFHQGSIMNTRDNKLSRRTFVGSMAGIGAGMSIAREAAAEAKYDAGSPVFEHTTPGIIDIHTHFSSDMDSKAHLEATKTDQVWDDARVQPQTHQDPRCGTHSEALSPAYGDW